MTVKISQIEGRGLPMRGHDIDTDRIIPARFLRSITYDGLEQHLFEDDRKTAEHPFDDARYRGASILLVNANFGCGSSREHAPQALKRWGIGAVVGESFAEIFFGNSVMIGLPCVAASPQDVRSLMELVERHPHAQFRVDLGPGTCEADGLRCAVTLPSKIREAFATGAWDTTGMLLDHFQEVEAAATRLPYVSGF